MISIIVNGKPRELDGEVALPDFLRQLDVDERRIAVAINDEVIPKNQHKNTTVRDGDAVEIVRMVGGGSAGRGSRVAGGGRQRGASVPAFTFQAPTVSSKAVVVVGGGIIGCAIACELSRCGVPCLVLDSRRIGMAATNASAGVLAPLAEFKRPGPLVRLGLESLRRYPAWVERLRADAPDIDVEFQLNGVLRVAFDEQEMSELRAGAPMARDLGMELIELDQQALRGAEPRLNEGLIGGVLCPEEGQINQQLFTLALSRGAKKRGARIIEDAPVLGFDKRAGRVVGVRTPQGAFACDHLVLAAGPWTRPLARKLAADVPARPIRGQMLAFGRMLTPIHQPVWGPRGYLLPRANGLVFAGATVEDVGFRFHTTKRGLGQVRRAAFELVPQLRHAREHFSWFGLRPGSPDGLPIMGALPGWENATVATGHFRNGILLAPITGELIAQAIVEGRPSEALAPFDPARFNTR